MTVALPRRILTGVVASAVTAVVRGTFDAQAPGGQARWTRRSSSVNGSAIRRRTMRGQMSRNASPTSRTKAKSASNPFSR